MYKEEDFQDAIRLIGEGRINVASLITDRFPFLQYLEAYRYIDEGTVKSFMKEYEK